MIEETWLQPCIDEVRKRLRKPSVMVDIGANKGDWTAHLLGDFDCIVAVEPDRRNVADLNARFANEPTVFVLPQAVGPKVGTATFYQRDGHAQSSLSEDHPFGHGSVEASYAVPVSTLPTFIDHRADFVKIDIEGGEADLDYPDNVTCYLIECHGTFDEVLRRMPPAYAVFRKDHPLGCEGHYWLFAVREVPDVVGD